MKGPSDTSIEAGDTSTINVNVTREKFNAPVELKFTDLPEGVSIMEKDLSISKDATSAKLTLKANPDAKAIDDHKVTVTASGGGMTEDVTFKVTVKGSLAAKKLTLKAPYDTSIKQNETATINVEVAREKFNAPVELKFTDLPEGVSIMEKDLSISKDATSAKLTLKATPNAKAIDDHKVTVTASGGGMTQEATFKVTVKK
ncbi:NHL repeat protein [Fimbriiglobus ruber]|uniref:NHL repeat protein n=1 Tax=Fimbriiglobus ruber TaxID=1908690 RepID=A0A225DJB4_9BACT|nr:NHL repeat protein [Fimbriiglobus ruber]